MNSKEMMDKSQLYYIANTIKHFSSIHIPNDWLCNADVYSRQLLWLGLLQPSCL